MHPSLTFGKAWEFLAIQAKARGADDKYAEMRRALIRFPASPNAAPVREPPCSSRAAEERHELMRMLKGSKVLI